MAYLGSGWIASPELKSRVEGGGTYVGMMGLDPRSANDIFVE